MQSNEEILDNRLGAERGSVGNDEGVAKKTFRFDYGEIVNQLVVSATVTAPKPWGDEQRQGIGIWDTGATNTVVNRKLLEKAGIATIHKDDDEPMTLTAVAYAGWVNGRLRIGNVVTPIFPVKVSDFDPDGRLAAMGHDVPDVLIGMDIIASGRLDVNSIGNETILTFEADF